MDRKTIVELYKGMNDYKMFHGGEVKKVPLHLLKDWVMEKDQILCRKEYAFKVIYCDVSIKGREVRTWRQPLIAANGTAVFGLICCDDDGMLKFLVKPRSEIGCLDLVEIGPTIQKEPYSEEETDRVSRFFFRRPREKKGIVTDIMLSEEGGRFYQEQNRNVILSVEKGEIGPLPEGYVWSDYGTLNLLTQINNCLNIQLRNLLSLLEI